MPCVVQQDVLWLEVPVDVTQQVKVLQRQKHLSSIELHVRLLQDPSSNTGSRVSNAVRSGGLLQTMSKQEALQSQLLPSSDMRRSHRLQQPAVWLTAPHGQPQTA
jgi:hypothetical protein